MKILPLLALGGGIYFFTKSQKYSNTTTSNVEKDVKGFKLSEDCKNFIVTDLTKAKTWAYDLGKQKAAAFLNKEKESFTDEVIKEILGSCKSSQLNESNVQNTIFTLQLTLSFIKGIIEYNLNKINIDNVALVLIKLYIAYYKIEGILNKYNIKESVNIKPLNLSIPFTEKVINLRGYDLKNCSMSIKDNIKFINFIYKVSEKLKVNDLNAAEYLFLTTVLDDCDVEIIDNLEYEDLYIIAIEFARGQIQNGTISKEEGNKYLKDLLADWEKEGVDTQGFKWPIQWG